MKTLRSSASRWPVLRELHPELLGDLKDDAIYKRVERLKVRMEAGDRLERTEPALMDLMLEQLTEER